MKNCLVLVLIISVYSSVEAANRKNFKSNENRQWEVGVDIGFSQFLGTYNFAVSDFLKAYRNDGNKVGYTIQASALHNFNSWIYLVLEAGTTALNGTATYKGIPTDKTTVKHGEKGAYDTRNQLIAGSIGFDIIDLLSNRRQRKQCRLIGKIGIGLSNTEIIKTPFTSEEGLYDFADSNALEATIPIGIRFIKSIDEQFSFYINWNCILVGGSKVDAYYLSQDPINEGLPTPKNAKMSIAPDVYTTLSFGLSYRW